MTNTENVYAIRDSNKAYAYLLGVALQIGNKHLYEKLVKDRSYFCDSIDRFYEENKTSSKKEGVEYARRIN